MLLNRIRFQEEYANQMAEFQPELDEAMQYLLEEGIL